MRNALLKKLFVLLLLQVSGCGTKSESPLELTSGYWTGGKGHWYVRIENGTGQIVLTNGASIPVKIAVTGPMSVRITELSVPPGSVSNYIPGVAAVQIIAAGSVSPCVYDFTFDGPDLLEGTKTAWLARWRAADSKVIGVENGKVRPESWTRLIFTNR